MASAALVLGGLLALYAAAGAPGWAQAGPMPSVASALAIVLVVALGSLALGWTLRKRGSALGTLAALAMVVGFGLLTGAWLLGHGRLPVGTLVLPMHQTLQTYKVQQGNRRVDVMLPLRMTLESVVLGREPAANIALSRIGESGVPAQRLGPGQSVDVSGLRFAFVGLVPQTDVYRAVVRSQAENTIPAAGVVGDTLNLAIGGEGYEVITTTANYLDALGPAVQLEDARGQRFWVFEEPADARTPGFEHGLWLEELQEVPAAVIQVSPVRPFGMLGAGAGLCVTGFLLMCVAGIGGGGRRHEDDEEHADASDDEGEP
ncbi:hypothetical protein DL240_04405 [Lujinxingia litoralis]|uniref:ResB-like domain-containing protein n=1 Tax=Lujinxingia litoralis TaxID=2211119 RepID=A0A328CE94_9DELT|nr:hypothetical protein [Lujinxingia litoralis]RAL25459.1 hypothetical protein DL240_04405 [Lujinxingia litoralis]